MTTDLNSNPIGRALFIARARLVNWQWDSGDLLSAAGLLDSGGQFRKGDWSDLDHAIRNVYEAIRTGEKMRLREEKAVVAVYRESTMQAINAALALLAGEWGLRNNRTGAIDWEAFNPRRVWSHWSNTYAEEMQIMKIADKAIELLYEQLNRNNWPATIPPPVTTPELDKLFFKSWTEKDSKADS